MAITSKSLTLAMAFVACSLQLAFAVDGKTPCTDTVGTQTSGEKIILSPTDQTGVMRGDDGSWWWQPSNGEPPFQVPPPEAEPEPEPEPEPDPSEGRVTGDGDESLAWDLEIYFCLDFLMKDAGLTFDEARESILTDLIIPRDEDETELKRPTFGPHMGTCDGMHGLRTSVE